MNELPIARGVFLCEKVIIEESTRYVNLLNCFSRRKVDRFPSEPMDFVLFALLLNGRGKVRLETVVEDAESLEEIDRQSVIFEFPDPLSELRFRMQYKAKSFQAPGKYVFNLLANGEIVATTVLTLEQRN